MTCQGLQGMDLCRSKFWHLGLQLAILLESRLSAEASLGTSLSRLTTRTRTCDECLHNDMALIIPTSRIKR